MKAFWIILLLLVPLPMIAADDEEAEGDEKILETIKKIQEEEEEEEEDADWDDEEDGDNGFCGCLLDACFEIGGELFLEYAIHIRFAPYPYAPSVGYNFSALDYHDLSGFAGAYIVTTTGNCFLSVGISSRIFFPGRLYLDLYGLYAFVSENAGILHLIGSLNFAIWRFAIGAGYNYNNYLGDVYADPCLKISFWL
jgi:hypothetical protein